MKNHLHRILAIIVLLVGSVSLAQQENLTLDQAHALARLTLTLPARHFSGMTFGIEEALRPGNFYWFSITANVPNDASPVLGAFAVNSVTGDVWDPVSCKKLVNKDVSALQRRLRREAHISEAAYAHAAQSVPCER